MPRPSKRVKLSREEDEGAQKTSSIKNGLGENRQSHERQNQRERMADVNNGSDISSSESEDEDDEGELATEALDTEIAATLQALRSKDPSIYDKSKQFYRPVQADTDDAATITTKTAKPMYLQDYHRQNLLAGSIDADADEDMAEARPVQTYDQAQEALRQSVVKAMHGSEENETEEADEDDLLVKKAKPISNSLSTSRNHKSSKAPLDVENADRDPETFLSNFMSSRAWVPEEGSRFANLDEDDSEEERLAETFEEAYNLRFEDPAASNEKMMTYARDAGKYSARRNEATGRKQRREKERETKDQVKAERDREKARLRNHKIDEMEQKVKQIREAAGIDPSEIIDMDEWKAVLDDDFDDDKWEEIMAKKFGDKYYAAEVDDNEGDSDVEIPAGKDHKKPKWEADIDIGDLESEKGSTASADDDGDSGGSEAGEKAENDETQNKPRRLDPAEKRRVARKQRSAIEALVDEQMLTESGPVENGEVRSHVGGGGGFRYRETSPTAFGLSARDILFADDKQLNEFAGIKKHHAFREDDKKQRDKKKLSKKARLRQWRKDTFGNEEGYQGELADFIREQQEGNDIIAARRKKGSGSERKSNDDKKRKAGSGELVDSEKKKKRRKKNKSSAVTGTAKV